MGGHSSSLRFKSRSTNDVDRIRPSAEQRSATKKKKNKLSSLAAASSRHFAKISFKRKSGDRDKIRTFRDLITKWPLEDAESLFREMDTMRQLFELYSEATNARPAVPSIGQQLLKSTTQTVEFVFKGERLPVHRRFARIRCKLITEMSSESTSVIELTSPLESITVEEFRDFINYLYTERCDLSNETLSQIKTILKITNPLCIDLETFEMTADEEGDFIIQLSSRPDVDPNHSINDHEIRLDSELIATRSELFASLVKRRHVDRVVLDENLLPRSMAPVIVHYLYTDQLDLSRISPSMISVSSLSEARAIVSGRNPDSPLHQASQLVHIAKFFGLTKLVHLCEDVIVDSLSIDTCVSILSWAEDGGSHFVANVSRAFLISEFSRIASTHHLFYLTIDQLGHLVASPFLQATELEILEAVIRWGEHELLKRMEKREPNIVADTSHSISRRGIRKTEESEKELREILNPISAFVRSDYILPSFHPTLTSAYGRGLLERSPLKDLVICSSTSEINPDLHWFCPDPHATGPRFYKPYFEALKTYLATASEDSSPTSTGSKYTTVRSSSSGMATPLKVIVVNSLPGVLDEETFRLTKERILTTVDEVDARFALCFMPRPFHKKTAVELILTRVLRELEVHPDSIEIRIAEWADSQGSTSTSSSVRLNLHSSQPALHWPDIMTLERRRKVRETEQSTEMLKIDADDRQSVYDL
ncbi:unnamed protein product, partial [Mesorhabditis belari]|uniref:BTB domain-containing protein n=1 Tax=Mesorhabditis belari TaxID=2138241 RepID=A0AAF3ETD2_9BILA